MAEHDVRGLAGVAGGDGLAQFVDVLDERLLAVNGQAAKLVCAGHALAVADVIGGAHHEALFHEEARELVVAAHMLHHAVDDLNDAARRDTTAAPRALGLPHEAFDGGRSVMRQKADRRDCDRCIHIDPLPRSFALLYPHANRKRGSVTRMTMRALGRTDGTAQHVMAAVAKGDVLSGKRGPRREDSLQGLVMPKTLRVGKNGAVW